MAATVTNSQLLVMTVGLCCNPVRFLLPATHVIACSQLQAIATGSIYDMHLVVHL